MPAVHPTPRFHALIPCAGTGSRAGTAQPKQYQSIAGQAMVMHTVQALTQVHQLNSGWLILSSQDDHVCPDQQLLAGDLQRFEPGRGSQYPQPVL